MVLRYTSSYDKTLAFSDTDGQLTLTANNVLTYTLPGDNTTRYTIEFIYNSNTDVFVGLNQTPAVPAGNTITVAPFVEYKPFRRYARGGDVLSFISPNATTYMGFSVRSIPS